MSDLDQQFYEDKALRDAAKANVLADIEQVKESLSGKGIAGRLFDRVGEGAKEVFEQASETAEDNRGVIAALIGAILLWMSRHSILELIGLENAEETEGHSDEAQSGDLARDSTGDDNE